MTRKAEIINGGARVEALALPQKDTLETILICNGQKDRLANSNLRTSGKQASENFNLRTGEKGGVSKNSNLRTCGKAS